jgi:hypothetical protein
MRSSIGLVFVAAPRPVPAEHNRLASGAGMKKAGQQTGFAGREAQVYLAASGFLGSASLPPALLAM